MMWLFLLECVLLYINTDSQSLGNFVLMQGTNSALCCVSYMGKVWKGKALTNKAMGGYSEGKWVNCM